MDADRLKALLNKSVLSSADKSRINKAYQSHFGRKPSTDTNCASCYHDAIAELYASIQLQSGAHRLCAGWVIEYEGKYYTRHSTNLPDWIIKNHRDKLETI